MILTLLAIGELGGDKLPRAPSRRSPAGFTARLVSDALSGAAIGYVGDIWMAGLAAGVVGAVIGTLGGHAIRMRLSAAIGRDWPAALIEDAIALGGATTIIAGVAVTGA